MERLHNVLHGGLLRITRYLLALMLMSSQFEWGVRGQMEVLTISNWTAVLDGKEWFVEFYAPWCGACRGFEPVWKKFSESAKELKISVGKVDITEEAGLAGRFLVQQLPTLYHIKGEQGSPDFRQFVGSRKLEDLKSFILEEKWREIEPVAWYMKPSAFTMNMLGYLTTLGDSMKTLSEVLSSEYGVPMWAIVGLGVFSTVLVGVFIGLVGNYFAELFIFRNKTASRAAPAPQPSESTQEPAEDDSKETTSEPKKDK